MDEREADHANKPIKNNSVPWQVATNRHRNCDGTTWGWIKGAPGNVCWSNSSASTSITEDEAHRIVIEHNASLPGRCEVCGWTLAKSGANGCVPGNCSYRPASDSPAGKRIDARRKALAARKSTPPKPCATCGGDGSYRGRHEWVPCPDCAGESGGGCG